MRHRISERKLGRESGPRTALRKTLVNQLFTFERVKTTRAKAEAIRSQAEGLITLAKRGIAAGDSGVVHARRLAAARMGSPETVKKLFDDIAPRYEDRAGGYTRMVKLGPRLGDAAEIVLLELVEG
jgi:large subunit ribosomal protein L17